MQTSLKRRFALIKWERVEAWLAVWVQMNLALNLLKAARLADRCGLISEASVARTIGLSAVLSRRANRVWAAYRSKRDLLRADAHRFLIEKDKPRGGRWR